jgi:hypothetical protein
MHEASVKFIKNICRIGLMVIILLSETVCMTSVRIWSRSSMDRMTDSGSVGWAFESPRDHEIKTHLGCKSG